MKVIRHASLSIAVLSLVFVTLAASAEEVDQTRSKIVNYGDLDLASAAGAGALYRRLKLAAREVCKTPDGGFGDPLIWLHCFHDALAVAIREVGHARVTTLYEREFNAGIPRSAHRCRLHHRRMCRCRLTRAPIQRCPPAYRATPRGVRHREAPHGSVPRNEITQRDSHDFEMASSLDSERIGSLSGKLQLLARGE
jgi:UrcA family protein